MLLSNKYLKLEKAIGVWNICILRPKQNYYNTTRIYLYSYSWCHFFFLLIKNSFYLLPYTHNSNILWSNIFHLLYIFVKAYIDNIVTGASLFEKYVANLQAIFNFCIQFNISIKSTKIFFNYFNVNFLGQHINSFNFTIVKNKILAIKAINYLITLNNL